ncbi:MAG: B3/B4 domain-containing protein [Candidatus Ranarchaeia archaeon]
MERLKSLPLELLKDDKVIRKYRDFYWQGLRIDPTKTRPAGEALIRRILQLKPFPRILNAVDAYNLASIDTHLSFGAYDFAKINPPIEIRLSNHEDQFWGIGMSEPKYLDLKTLVMSDQKGIACVYPYRDADRTKIGLETNTLLLMTAGVPGILHDTLTEGTKTATEYIQRVAGGSIVHQVVVP